MFCKNCGKEISDGATFCPECGSTMGNQYSVNANNQKRNTMSIVGAVVSFISLLLNFWGLVGIAAVILSVIGLIQIGKTGEKGKGMAITGIVIGSFSIIYGLVMILLFM